MSVIRDQLSFSFVSPEEERRIKRALFYNELWRRALAGEDVPDWLTEELPFDEKDALVDAMMAAEQ